MPDREKVIADIEEQIAWIQDNDFHKFPGWGHAVLAMKDALVLLKEQEARIQKYEYFFDFLGIGFRQWATRILNGEAEAICETDEHEYKTVVTFKRI